MLPSARLNDPVPELTRVMVVANVRPETETAGGVIAGKLVIATLDGCEKLSPMVSGLVRIVAPLTVQVPASAVRTGG